LQTQVVKNENVDLQKQLTLAVALPGSNEPDATAKQCAALLEIFVDPFE